MFSRATTIALLALLAMPRDASAEPAPSTDLPLLQRLRQHAVAEWVAMENQLRNCDVELTVAERDRGGRHSTNRTKQIIGNMAGSCFLFREILPATQQTAVYARNERYEFALSRNGEGPWTVVWRSGRQENDTPVQTAHAYVAGMLRLPWSISAMPLAKLVNDPRVSIQAVNPPKQGLVQFDFTVSPDDEPGGDLQRLASGTVVLDPARRWAITQYRARYTNQMHTAAAIEYATPGPPEIKKLRFQLHTRSQASEFAVDVAKYDWIRDRNLHATLPAFGLPDYKEPARSKRWLRLVNAGIIFLLASFMVWRRRQEKSLE
jgi:hypothetical protein